MEKTSSRVLSSMISAVSSKYGHFELLLSSSGVVTQAYTQAESFGGVDCGDSGFSTDSRAVRQRVDDGTIGANGVPNN